MPPHRIESIGVAEMFAPRRRQKNWRISAAQSGKPRSVTCGTRTNACWLKGQWEPSIHLCTWLHKCSSKS